MEILGHALVDMRDAPDAQVVLEIAVVRAVRPDLDSGIEALAERVSVLERSLSGAAAFPGPVRPPRRPAPRTVAAAPVGRRSGRATAGGRRPAPFARGRCGGASRAAEARRPADAADEPAAAADTGAARRTEPPTPAAGAGRHGLNRPSAGAIVAAAAVDRDSLTEAWGDGILQGLPARAKALFAQRPLRAGGRGGCAFRAAQRGAPRPCVEMAARRRGAAAHFGAPVKLVLEIDASAAPPRTARPQPVAASAEPASSGAAVVAAGGCGARRHHPLRGAPEPDGPTRPTTGVRRRRGRRQRPASEAEARLTPGASPVDEGTPG